MERAASPAAMRLAAAIALVVLSGVWAWWAVKEGGYFGSVLYPGLVVLCLGFLLVASRTVRGERLAISLPARLTVGALVGLAAWSALSAFWSPAPDIAVADAQRIFGYALAFGLGLWLVTLAGARAAHLALVPLAFGALAGGIAAIAVLLTGDDFVRYVDEGTLQYPLGYRNANAAFFLIALWPAVGLAASPRLAWPLRALALGTATLCLELAALSQSRASMIAAALALAAFLVLSSERARHVAWLVLAIAPALVVIPSVTDLYATADFESYTGVSELRGAGRAAAGGAALAVLVGAAAALIGGRTSAGPVRLARANRAVAAGAAVLILGGAAAFTVTVGDPADWASDRIDEFLTQGTPGSEGGSRFGVNAGSERDDLWRVALDVAGDDPVVGTGGGGYQYVYLVHRGEDGVESVRDAHSVELEVLSELGAVGLILFALALASALAGAWRARRGGLGEAAVATIALTAAVYWLAHSSLDWFWTYPVVTAPVFALLGSACGLSARQPGDDRDAGPWRRAAAVGAIGLALSVIPPYLSERYVQAAYDGWREDPARAQDDLDRARSLNGLSIEPLLAQGAIAQVQGEREDAIAAFREAAEERPEEWATHYFLAELQLKSDPEAARAELDRALELNPYSIDLAKLEVRLNR